MVVARSPAGTLTSLFAKDYLITVLSAASWQTQLVADTMAVPKELWLRQNPTNELTTNYQPRTTSPP